MFLQDFDTEKLPEEKTLNGGVSIQKFAALNKTRTVMFCNRTKRIKNNASWNKDN